MDRRLATAVDASVRWYEDVFAVHGIPTSRAEGLWYARSEPPRWHSAAKTLEPSVPAHRVTRAVEPFEHCSVADSIGDLDLSGAGFELLFEATWVHHAPSTRPASVLPGGWSVVSDENELDQWNNLHDTTGVLVPALLAHPRLVVLARREGEVLSGGAVLHDCRGDAVGLSNAWALPGTGLDASALVTCAGALHPGRGIVDYARGEELDALLEVGFRRVGPHVVWVR